MANEHILPYYLLVAEERKDRLMPFPKEDKTLYFLISKYKIRIYKYINVYYLFIYVCVGTDITL